MRGAIKTLSLRGGKIIVSGPQLQIWRGPTDNDGIKLRNDAWRPLASWRKQGFDKMVLETISAQAVGGRNGTVILLFEQIGSCAVSKRAFRHKHVYTISPDGTILAKNTFVIDKCVSDLPRLGVTLTLHPGFEKLKWFGRGPLENYRDRNRSSLVDLYTSTVAEQYVPYIMPQEHGNHTDVRWLSLEDEKIGLCIKTRRPLEFSASRFTAHDLYTASHTYDLKPRPEIILNLDYRQRGLGTASCGPDVLDKYKIEPGTYQWDFTIQSFVVE
jgi:beta-galactosidase